MGSLSVVQGLALKQLKSQQSLYIILVSVYTCVIHHFLWLLRRVSNKKHFKKQINSPPRFTNRESETQESWQVIPGRHRGCKRHSWSQALICRLTTACYPGRAPNRSGFSADMEADKLHVPLNFVHIELK